jgi:hypothetical protein
MKLNLMILALSFSFLSEASTVFKGTVKGTGEKCELEIVQTYFENNIENSENFRADITATIEDGDASGHKISFTVKAGARPQFFSGIGDNQKDMINILTENLSKYLENPKAYSLKWWHVSHFHTGQCLNLTK